MSLRVSLFATCVIDQLFPQVAVAMTNVLERIGCSVEFPPDQTCCGQPAFNSGFRDEARSVGRHFLKVFRDCDYIVVPSGSCTAMVNHHFENLFAGDDGALADARAVRSRVWEFSQFLLEVAHVDDVGARCEKVVTYHDSCHALRELKIKDGPRRLLSKVKGLTLAEMDKAAECCGFGGTFSVKFPDVSGSMVQTKIESIQRTNAEAVVSIDSSCLMQIRGALSRAGSPIETMHLAEVLDSH